MRLAIACLVAALSLLALPGEASACPSSSESRFRVLGVDEDGNFVEYQKSWSENGDGESERFVAYDKNGKEIASLGISGAVEGDYFAEMARAEITDPKVIELDLIKNKALEKPTRRKMRHVKTEAQCGSLEIESKSGWLRVAEVGTVSYQFESACPPIFVEAFEHPKLSVTLVRTKYMLGRRAKTDADIGFTTYEDEDDIHHLPNSRIEAAELWLLGERARLDRNLAKAIPMIERAIRIAPEFMPARSSLIRAYAKDGRSWEELVALLETEVPRDTARIGQGPSDELIDTLRATWKEAGDYELGRSWGPGSMSPFYDSFI